MRTSSVMLAFLGFVVTSCAGPAGPSVPLASSQASATPAMTAMTVVPTAIGTAGSAMTPTAQAEPISTPEPPPGPGTWASVGGASTRAETPVAAMAAEGRVLLLDAAWPCYFPGDMTEDDFGPSPAAVFWPGTGDITKTTSFDKPRFGFAMASLPDGRVLVAGGANEHGVPKSSTRIWDPVTGMWSEAALMTLGRDRPVAVGLQDGRVLVAGGMTPSGNPTKLVEIYSASLDLWARTGSLPFDNETTAAAALSDGRVLALQVTDLDGVIFGGGLYDPERRTWAEVEGPPGDRSGWLGADSLVALADGTALLFGGSRDVLRFDPAMGWSKVGRLTTSRPGATVTGLGDGRVLVAGGVAVTADDVSTARVLESAELFDPRTGRSSKAASMPVARTDAVGTRLSDGSVLVAGGASDANNGDTPWCPTLLEHAVRWIP